MNTERSDAIITRFQDRSWKSERTVFQHEGPVLGTPEEVFPLLCPAREADWIPTWNADIVYSETGYAGKGDVFRTPDSSGFGAGVWVFIGYEENRYVELVQTTADLLVHMKVSLAPLDFDKEGKETLVRWDVVITSLTPEGAAKMAEGVVSAEKYDALLVAMNHYRRHGELVQLPAAG